MAGRHTKGPLPIQSRQFTLDDIESGARKLRRRLEEVRALDPQTTRHDDERLVGASRNIKADLIDIFGQNSPEYRAHGTVGLLCVNAVLDVASRLRWKEGACRARGRKRDVRQLPAGSWRQSDQLRKTLVRGP